MKKGFTLAEVLITLGIIGVVAAMTIPTLISNYQKRQFVTGLQKGYSIMNNALKMALAEDLTDNLNQTSLWQALPEDSSQFGNPNAIDFSEFVGVLSKYLKVQKYCNPEEDGCFNIQYKILNGDDDDGFYTKSNRLKVYTADGLVYYFRLKSNTINEDIYWDDNLAYNLIGYIGIDVNGDSGPNQNGRDYFDILVFNNGKLMFPGTQEWKLIDNAFGDWEGVCDVQYTGMYPGDYCGARIFEEGWRMDY